MNNKHTTQLWVLAFLFGFLAIAVKSGWTQGFDDAILTWLHPITNSTLASVARDITSWASAATVCFAMLIYMLYCAVDPTNSNDRPDPRPAFIAVALAFIFDLAWKLIVQRDRPSIVSHLTEEGGYSFPSSHASAAVAFWWTVLRVAYIRADRVLKARGRSEYDINYAVFRTIVSLTFFGIALVCTSRVMLGVHYPTDCIGGWLLGFFCSALSINWLVIGDVNASSPPSTKAKVSK